MRVSGDVIVGQEGWIESLFPLAVVVNLKFSTQSHVPLAWHLGPKVGFYPSIQIVAFDWCSLNMPEPLDSILKNDIERVTNKHIEKNYVGWFRNTNENHTEVFAMMS